MPRTTIVTTTIYTPHFLKAYAENIKRYGHNDVDIIVIGDRKTPLEARSLCNGLENCKYYDLIDQDAYMLRFPELAKHLPLDSIARRNIGHLLAYENGAETILMLDDDNLATSQDVIKHHSIVGQCVGRKTYGSSSGWFNVCSALEEKHGVEFYARGYPPNQRWKDGLITTEFSRQKVAVNGGLWLNDPDIDALTRIERHLIVIGTKAEMPRSFALSPGTWSPWNCQNTAISRSALPSYFLSPHTGRHLDIWASYITSRIAESLSEVITFGTPLAYHERSPHNLYKDLEQELPWIMATDEFVEALRGSSVGNISYLNGLRDVIEGLRSHWCTKHPIKDLYLDGLTIWSKVFDKLGA